MLTAEARLVLKKYRPKIVAVTGSVGKTSTKDAIYTVLSSSAFVRRSEKSFNSDFGVPLTIIAGQNGWNNPIMWAWTLLKGLYLVVFPNKYPRWLVLEIGADRPGDIETLVSWIKPDMVVLTRFGEVPVHVEFFKSRQSLIDEKAYLAKALKPEGFLVVNGDDKDAMNIKMQVNGRKITYGFAEGADVRGSNYAVYFEKNGSGVKNDAVIAGISFKVNVGGSCLPVVRKGVLGQQHVYPSLAALALAVALDLNLVSSTEALSKGTSPSGRMKLISGIKGSLIIDDSYNSSPVATEVALDTLKSLKDKDRRLVAVLGDMLELGKHSTEEHRKLGGLSARCADILVVVGMRAMQIADGAHAAGMSRHQIFEFENSNDAGRFLDEFVREGDIILVKGSQSMRMEKIVEEIMLNPEEKEKLLVRQDAEWQKR